MRAYTIAIFILMFCLVQSAIDELELFPVGISSIEGDSLATTGELMVDDMKAVGGDIAEDQGFFAGLVGLSWKLGSVIWGTFGQILEIGPLLKELGVPNVFADLLQTITIFILAFAMFQIWSNRGVKQYE